MDVDACAYISMCDVTRDVVYAWGGWMGSRRFVDEGEGNTRKGKDDGGRMVGLR